MDSINKKIILLSVIMALVTTGVVYFYIQNKTQIGLKGVKKVTVFVAAKTLPQEHEISEIDLKQIKIPKEYINSNCITDVKQIVGKRLKESVIKDEQILFDRLVDNDEMVLSYKIPKNKRAISINVTEQTQVANLIKQNDYVDVIASFEKEEIDAPNGGKAKLPRITKTILERVKVIAIGQELKTTQDKNQKLPVTVTLEIPSEDVEKLVYASDFAQIRLSLRYIEDEKNINTLGVKREDFEISTLNNTR